MDNNNAGEDAKYSRKEELLLFLAIARSLVEGVVLLFWHLLDLVLPRKPKSVRGQLALVTGGANGIGRQMALNLAKAGCHIAVVDVDAKGSEQTVRELRELGVKAEAFCADVSRLEEMVRLRTAVEDQMGFVDILVNNAGIFITRDITEEKPENLQRMIDINLMAHFWANRIFLPGMIDRKRGHIVATASAAGLVGVPAAITYCTSKFGVRGFMESLTLQLHHQGHGKYIKTTTIFPHFIPTNPDVTASVIEGCKQKTFFDLVKSGKRMVDGILRNEEIITIPGALALTPYVFNPPMGVKKLLIDHTAIKGFRGVSPRNA